MREIKINDRYISPVLSLLIIIFFAGCLVLALNRIIHFDTLFQGFFIGIGLVIAILIK